MENNGSIRPRASTFPDRLQNRPKQKSANSKTAEKRTGSFEKIAMDIPNGMRSPRSPTPELNSVRLGYSSEGPKRKPRAVSKLSVPEANPASPRRRASAVVPPNPGELTKPVSNGLPKARRRSCPALHVSPRSILNNHRLRSPAIRIDSPRSDYDSQDNSPKSVWEEIDETLDKPNVDIQRQPLPGGSPEFRRCMTQVETLDINEPEMERPRRLSTGWQPKVIHGREPLSPRSPRRVRWLDVS